MNVLVKDALYKILKDYTKNTPFEEYFRRYLEEKNPEEFPFAELCIMHYEAYTKEFNNEIYKVAAALEILLLAFDILDDLQDNDSNNCWMKETAFAINTAVAMIYFVQKVFLETSFVFKERAIAIITDYSFMSLEGQQQDLKNSILSEEAYLELIEKKSGSLVALCCLVGCVLASGKTSKEVKKYAFQIGALKQVENDILDISTFYGKNDLLNRKWSFPIIYLFSLDNHISEFLTDYYENLSLELDICIVKEGLYEQNGLLYSYTVRNYLKGKIENYLIECSIDPILRERILNII